VILLSFTSQDAEAHLYKSVHTKGKEIKRYLKFSIYASEISNTLTEGRD